MKKGVKHDQKKERWDLLPWICIQEVVKVLTFGCVKYSDNNWQQVEDPRKRYFSAAHRHLYAWARGYEKDDQSKLPHLAHAVCNLLFLLWFDLTDKLVKRDPISEIFVETKKEINRAKRKLQ